MKINNCRVARAQMLPFLSGELMPETAAQMSAHLDKCARCASYMASLENTAQAIDVALMSAALAPPTLDARVMATIRRSPARGRAWPQFSPPWARARQLRLALGVAGALFVGFASGALWRAPQASPMPPTSSLLATLPPDELVTAYQMMKGSLMARGTSEAQVAARLRALAPEGANANIELVALHNPDAKIVGGCWMNIGGHSVPSFCYEWQGKRVSIFQTPSGVMTAGMLSLQCGEVSMVSWKQGDRTFALVTEAAPEKSLQMARQVDEI